MTAIDDSMARVRAFIQRPGWSKARLAEASGLHKNALRRVDDPAWSGRVETLNKVLRTIDDIEAAGPAEAA